MSARLRFLPSVLLLVVAAGCTGESESSETSPVAAVDVQGECGVVYDGEICTWGTMEESELTGFGFTVSMGVVEGAPLDEAPTFPPVSLVRIPFPDEVKSGAGMDHLGVNWEVMGHPPETFMTPHFDFHVYAPASEVVDAIDCSDTSKPEVLPAGYVMPDVTIPEMNMTMVGACVPAMGMHAMNEVDAQSTQPFAASMIVGYYGAEPIFFEPMVSHAHMMSRQAIDLVMPSVSGKESWPTSFTGVFDEAAGVYRFTFGM